MDPLNPIASPFYQFKTRQRKEWDKFLNAYVYLNENDYRTTMPRLDALRIFCREGLLPFVKAHGYTWNRDYNCVNHLATMLFRKWPRDFIVQELSRSDFPTEFDFYIGEGIPQEDWDSFWNTWGTLTDFHEDSQRNRYFLPVFVFNRLDLEMSPASRRYEDLLFDNEDSQDEGTLNESLVYVKDKKSMY